MSEIYAASQIFSVLFFTSDSLLYSWVLHYVGIKKVCYSVT